MRGAIARLWKLALPAPTIYLPTGPLLARAWPLAMFLLLLPRTSAQVTAADRLILRNLTLIADRTVVAVDEDGARLDKPRALGGDRVTWDEIERGRVSAELQPQFDRLKAELGPPLYLLRQRLRIGDYAGLLAPAETLYPRFADRQSQTGYLVCQSLMWGRLAAGRREEAVEPFLRCVVLLSGGAADAKGLPGPRRLPLDAGSPLCGDLPPVWLDPESAKAVLPAIEQLVKEMPMPRPAEAYLYYASLAAEAGQFDEASKVLDAIPDSPEGLKEARQLVRAQLEIERRAPGGATSELPRLASSEPSAASALARYWRGMHLVSSQDRDLKRDGLLSLLSIPANDGREQAELAAAALHQSAIALDQLGDAAGRDALRRELASRYAATAVGIQSPSVRGKPRAPAEGPPAR